MDNIFQRIINKAKALPVGAIRTHGGIKVRKQADGKWKPVKEKKVAKEKKTPKASKKNDIKDRERISQEIKQIDKQIAELNKKKIELSKSLSVDNTTKKMPLNKDKVKRFLENEKTKKKVSKIGFQLGKQYSGDEGRALNKVFKKVMSFSSRNESRYTFHSFYFKNGNIISSDTQRVIRHPMKYPKTLEGKLLSVSGNKAKKVKGEWVYVNKKGERANYSGERYFKKIDFIGDDFKIENANKNTYVINGFASEVKEAYFPNTDPLFNIDKRTTSIKINKQQINSLIDALNDSIRSMDKNILYNPMGFKFGKNKATILFRMAKDGEIIKKYFPIESKKNIEFTVNRVEMRDTLRAIKDEENISISHPSIELQGLKDQPKYIKKYINVKGTNSDVIMVPLARGIKDL